MRIDDVMLMAYVDGEIDAATAREIERTLAADPVLNARMRALRDSAAMARAIAAAIGTPPMPHRVDAERSATGITVATLGCSNSRITSGEKLLSDDCAQSMEENLSPGCQSRSP